MVSTHVMPRSNNIPPRTMLEVFKKLPEGLLIQLIENKLIMSPAPATDHQRVLGKIFVLMANYIEKQQLGEVLVSPLDVFLDATNAFQPDIIFVNKQRIDIIKNNGIYGTPDLVIELLSPGTAKYDQKQKKRVYERCGVQEYWIINPVDKSAQGFQLIDAVFVPLAPSKGHIHSRLLSTTFHF